MPPSRPIRQLLLSLVLTIIFGLSLLPVVFGASFTLYDGSLGTYPAEQGFVYQSVAISATQTITTEGVILDTTPRPTEMVGYFGKPTAMPMLDRQSGYTINFTVQVVTETHTINDRAGFSLIALSDDLEGIELGFWANEIWAQEGGYPPPFTHAEGVTISTASLISYHLAIQGNAYTLSSGATPLLTGSLRNYSTCAPPTCIIANPYVNSNFLFFGDDTSVAGAKIKLTSVSVSANPVPAKTVAITGPISGYVGLPYTFTATTSPINAYTPITYTWQAADQTPITHTNNLSDSLSFSWTTTGAKQITVTAYDGSTPVTNTHTMTLTLVGEGKVYLPLILKGLSESTGEHTTD